MKSLRQPFTHPESMLIGIGQASALLGITPRTLRIWSDAGRVPTQRLGGEGGHRRYQLADIVRIRDSYKVPQPA